jgi:hypothetical protein
VGDGIKGVGLIEKGGGGDLQCEPVVDVEHACSVVMVLLAVSLEGLPV